MLLDAMRLIAYVERVFVRTKDQRGLDGLEVELDRKWIDQNLEMFVACIGGHGHHPGGEITSRARST